MDLTRTALYMVGFYHIACMGGWREVVQEQTRVLSRYFSGPLKIGIVGSLHEEFWVRAVMDHYRIEHEIVAMDEDLARFEYTTLEALDDFARSSDAPEHIFYLHTKGVSTANWWGMMWRWMMMETLCRHIMNMPKSADVGCANWCEEKTLKSSYPEGNFWIAKTSYLRTLPPMARFHREDIKRLYGCPPGEYPEENERYAAELWLGRGRSAPKVDSLYRGPLKFYYVEFFFQERLMDRLLRFIG